jgi:branched-chain amino acid transport system ATP-binding protein
MPPILSMRGVVAGYGAGDVLKGLDLEIEPKTISCLIGPNGAGKSTVLKVASGLLRPKAGTVMIDGESVGGAPTLEILKRGVVHVPQDHSLFPKMTVWDNMLMGAYVLRDRAMIDQRLETLAARFPIVDRKRHAHAGSLSGGEQRTVEIARALMLTPRLIMLDEPSIGLEPRARRMVFDTIAQLREENVTVVLVEQNAKSALQVSDHAVVLETGRVRLRGSGSELLENPEVARLYLGGSTLSAPAKPEPSAAAAGA